MAHETAGAGNFGYDQRPVTPRIVYYVAGSVALLGVLNILRVVIQTAQTFTGDEWSSGARTMFLLLNAIPIAVSVFFLPLAHQLIRGRSWAWITAVILVALACVIGALALVIMIVNGLPWLGLVMFGAPVGVLLGLTVPRSVRAFYDSKPPPPPSYPTYPGYGQWNPHA
jgi:hypothetical protein